MGSNFSVINWHWIHKQQVTCLLQFRLEECSENTWNSAQQFVGCNVICCVAGDTQPLSRSCRAGRLACRLVIKGNTFYCACALPSVVLLFLLSTVFACCNWTILPLKSRKSPTKSEHLPRKSVDLVSCSFRRNMCSHQNFILKMTGLLPLSSYFLIRQIE